MSHVHGKTRYVFDGVCGVCVTRLLTYMHIHTPNNTCTLTNTRTLTRALPLTLTRALPHPLTRAHPSHTHTPLTLTLTRAHTLTQNIEQ